MTVFTDRAHSARIQSVAWLDGRYDPVTDGVLSVRASDGTVDPASQQSFYLKPVAPFQLFQTMNYPGQPDLTSNGFQRADLIGGASLWEHTPPFSEDLQPDLRYIEAQFASAQLSDTFVWNAEHYGLGVSNTTEERANGVEKMLLIQRKFRELHTQKVIGWYDEAPARYWPIVDQLDLDDESILALINGESSGSLQLWNQATDEVAPLVAEADIVFPSFYVPEAWAGHEHRIEVHSRLFVQQIRRIQPQDKPIIPFVWMKYWPDGGNGFVNAVHFRRMLDVISELCDGVIFWSGSSPTDPWSDLDLQDVWTNAVLPWISDNGYLGSPSVPPGSP